MLFDIILYLICFIAGFRIIRLITTPLCRKVGLYKYYSPMFMIIPLPGNLYDIHLGTSWDFIKIKNNNSQKIFYHMLEGILNVADAIEKKEIKSNAKFRGNTFYLKEDSLIKYGFKSRKMNYFESFFFVLNYIELCILYSISRKRITVIPLSNVRIVEFTGEEILQSKTKLQRLMDILNKRQDHQGNYKYRVINKKETLAPVRTREINRDNVEIRSVVN